MARALNLEPAEVRRRNMIRADEMPYRVGTPYRDGEPIVYDGGDYPGALDKALDAVGGLAAFRERQAAARARRPVSRSRHRLLRRRAPASGRSKARCVRIDPSGKVYVAGGACPQGQGMETIFSQIAADLWKVRPEDVVMSLADTSALAIGFGTVASRSTVTLSAAMHHASERLRNKVFAIAANILECAEADLELRDGGVGIVGVPGGTLSLARIAAAARPGWENERPPGIDAGLEETFYWQPPTVTWSYAVHAAIVEVDVETGRTRIDDYAVAHDCGVVVNPMLVEGQIIGGAVQGIGGVLCEAIAYDANGQLLSGSLMDYALPVASDVPTLHIAAPAFAVAVESARGQGRGGRRRRGTACGNRQRGVRRFGGRSGRRSTRRRYVPPSFCVQCEANDIRGNDMVEGRRLLSLPRLSCDRCHSERTAVRGPARDWMKPRRTRQERERERERERDFPSP